MIFSWLSLSGNQTVGVGGTFVGAVVTSAVMVIIIIVLVTCGLVCFKTHYRKTVLLPVQNQLSSKCTTHSPEKELKASSIPRQCSDSNLYFHPRGVLLVQISRSPSHPLLQTPYGDKASLLYEIGGMTDSVQCSAENTKEEKPAFIIPECPTSASKDIYQKSDAVYI